MYCKCTEFFINKKDNMRTKKAMLLGVIFLLVVLLGACAAPAPETVVFPDENMEAAIRDALGKPAGEAITPAELTGLTELDAAMQGIHPKIVQERLGHSSIQITLDTYSHVAPGLQDAAAQAI